MISVATEMWLKTVSEMGKIFLWDITVHEFYISVLLKYLLFFTTFILAFYIFIDYTEVVLHKVNLVLFSITDLIYLYIEFYVNITLWFLCNINTNWVQYFTISLAFKGHVHLKSSIIFKKYFLIFNITM